MNLQPFCATKNDPREWLRAPFTQGEFTFACNGHIAVRVDKCCDTPNVSNIAKLFDGYETYECSPFIIRLPAPKKCQRCSNGRVRECPGCEGNGYFDYRGYDYNCQECGARGTLLGGDDICILCDGTGLDEDRPIMYRDICIGVCYARLILTLPNIQVAASRIIQSLALPFRFDGGYGLLMGRTDCKRIAK